MLNWGGGRGGPTYCLDWGILIGYYSRRSIKGQEIFPYSKIRDLNWGQINSYQTRVTVLFPLEHGRTLNVTVHRQLVLFTLP
jgi:hypothetical protein